MKPSDLKIGDHFRRLNTPGACVAVVETLPATRNGSCRVVTAGDGLLGYLPVGRHSQIDPGTEEVEIVPMPAPYEVGKAYRTRGGKKATYDGATRGKMYEGTPYRHSFNAKDDMLSSTDTGSWNGSRASDSDIMGEWIETNSTPKDNTVKRTLPTVTLDQIFQALVEKKACWASAGPIALAKRLEALNGKETPDKTIDLRRLNRYVIHDHLAFGEAEWVFHNVPAIRPEGFTLSPFGEQLTERIKEWENPAPPKPKLPPVTLTLDGETAAILLTVLDNVGGTAVDGHPRAAMHALRSTLHSQNVHGADVRVEGSVYLHKKA